MVAIRSLDVTTIEPRIILHAAGNSLVIPGGNALLTAEFHHLGPDLLIHSQHGSEVLIHDYFAADHTPALMTESGLRLDGDLVTALARPEGYLQLAQDQTAQADTNGGAQPIGKVDTMTGSVEVHHADGSTAQLAQGAPVFQGDVIQTGADGQIGITFVDGTAFSLEPGARMTLDDLVYSSDGKNNSFSASVLQGTFVFMAGKIAPSGHMEVKTPVGTIGIRGTTVGGHLSMDGNDNTIVLFRDARTGHLGKVEFTNAGGSQILDTPNASTHVTSFFAAPSAPIPLPPQDAQQYFNEMLQHFYDQHGGAPTGKEGNNSQPGQSTADQLADQMDLGNFDTAAGPGAHGDGSHGDGHGSHDPMSSLLGFVPPAPTAVYFTSLSLTGGLLFGENGFGGFGNEGPGSHITQDNLGQFDQGANGGFTVINGTPGNDNLGSATVPGRLQIFGNAGDDVLTGSSFDDQIHGGAGNDILDGGAGNDQVFGDAGNDTFDGGTGLGNDHYDGGDGVDTVEYSSATLNLTINLTTGTASGDPDIGSDTLVNIENVIGGSGNDTITGNAADNVLNGGAGNDTLIGLGGNDTLNGGSGIDVAVFSGLRAEYTITLAENGSYIVTDSQANRDGSDTLIDIERVQFKDGAHDIADLLNHPPSAPADADASNNTVAAHAAAGTTVGITATSTDPDGDKLTYSLAGDTSNGGFQIDPTTGLVTVADGSKIDFNTAPNHQYQITVDASDGTLHTQTTFNIGVGDNPPSAPTDTDAKDNLVQEHAETGTAVGVTVNSTDLDGDTVKYTLIGDSSNGGFQIDADTGIVTVLDGSKIDYDAVSTHSYQITVEASDGTSKSDSSFTIQVQPAPAPSIDLDGDNSSGDATTGYKTDFSGHPVAVADSDAIVTVADGAMITSATLQLAGVTNQAQEALVAGSGLPAGISVSSFTYENGVGTLTLSGLASAADYAAALESIQYQNSTGGLVSGSRTVTITVTDDIGHVSNAATTLIDIASTARIIGDVVNGDPLIIGNIGHGEVDIFAGGQAPLHQIIIGNMLTGNGLLQLDPGSTVGLGADTVITVGNAGIGQLSASGTSSASSEIDAGRIVIGAQGTGIGTVTLHAGSDIKAADGTIAVGERGLGFLTIQGTSAAPSTAIANQVVIGDQSHGGGVLLVDGSAASLVTEGDDNSIIVGNQGTGFLGVSGGGLVETLSLEIGRDGTGNAIIGGTGTKVIVGDDNDEPGFLRVGKTDDGNGSLSVIAGALLTIEAGATDGTDKAGPTLMIADEAGSRGTVIIDGNHSTISLSQSGMTTENTDALTNGPRVIVGHQGDAALTVQNHGLLSLTGQGASLEIGAGDSDQSPHHLPQSVATVSSGGHITLTDDNGGDGSHAAAGGITIGGAADGNGKLVVTGTGSVVTVQSIDGVTVGDSGTGALTVNAGGSLSIQSQAGAIWQSGLTIARNETANGSVTVSGTGSQLQILSPNIGGLLEGPFLIMAAGQSLFQVTDHANVLIQGEGANFIVGSEATSLAQASILGGATMTVDGKDGDATVVVASQAGSDGSLTIDGTHSHLTIQGETDQMLIGAAFNGNQDAVAGQGGDADVKISNGGTLEVGTSSTHGGGSAEIVIGSHGSLDIANGTVIGDISDHGGEISIGHDVIATATLIGNLDMSSPASTLEIDASGASAGHADKLNVTGDVALTAATIDFHFLNNYAPHAGDTFSFLTASNGVSADLSDISLVAHNVDSSFRFELLTSEHDIQFHALTNAGHGSSDVFLGGDKNDSFTATGNNNALFGGAGDDTLTGSNTGNLIQGGAGADHMTGGKGADTFSFMLPSDGVQVSDNSTVAKDSASFDHIINFDAKSDTISFAPGYSQSAISNIDSSNFSKIDSAYDGTNGTSAAYHAGNASFILDGNNNLIYDNNGSKAGYTIVAHIDVAPGSPAITAHNLHVA